ncbi:MAG: ribokinase [Erysipelotrichaceae bacterium]|nr:ribokinase [Erysipelotrichaceae bacterium]
MKKILVIGSVSVDNVTYTHVLPQPGTTVFGDSFLSNVGGKGANQACAIKFLGGNITFFGAVGHDQNGQTISSFLKAQDLTAILKPSKQNTGVASITLDTTSGENRIIIVPGANMDISESDVSSILEQEKDAKILLIQLENPVKSVCFALKQAKEMGMITILNPAPYHELPTEIFPYIDFFVPNEHELDGYIENEPMTYEQKAQELLKLGMKNVIVTLGEKGSLLANENDRFIIEAIKVKAVDTTAAGDSYLGAFAYSLSIDQSIVEAMKFATRCSALTVTKKGAIASLPKKVDLN